jgi:hypothetical protein
MDTPVDLGLPDVLDDLDTLRGPPSLGLPDVLDDLDTIRAKQTQAAAAAADPGLFRSVSERGIPVPAAGSAENMARRPSSTPYPQAPPVKWASVRPSGPRGGGDSTLARNAQAEAVKLRIFRVFMPEHQGYVTLPFKPEMTLEQVRSAIVRKRGIVLSPTQAFAFQKTHEEIGGERTLVIPLSLKDFQPPTSDKEIPLFYTLGMLAREGESEIAMFVRDAADVERTRTPSRFL